MHVPYLNDCYKLDELETKYLLQFAYFPTKPLQTVVFDTQSIAILQNMYQFLYSSTIINENENMTMATSNTVNLIITCR